MHFAETLAAAIMGGLVAHFLTVWRDQQNRRRSRRIEYLVDAYRCLENLANRRASELDGKKIETAIADIQLFGTPQQIQLAKKFATTYAQIKTASLDSLLESFRESLRKELGLEKVHEKLVHLRHTQ